MAFVVIAFPSDRSFWTDFGLEPPCIRSVPSVDGGYSFERLPGGEYNLLATDLDSLDLWRDHDFLVRASRLATRVTLGWGGSATADLSYRVIPPK
jgi:hypothetical protein